MVSRRRQPRLWRRPRGLQRIVLWATPAAAAGVLLASASMGSPGPSDASTEQLRSVLLLCPLVISSTVLSWRSADERWATYLLMHTVHAVVGYAVLASALTAGTVAAGVVMLWSADAALLAASADWLAVWLAAAAGARALWCRAGHLPRSGACHAGRNVSHLPRLGFEQTTI